MKDSMIQITLDAEEMDTLLQLGYVENTQDKEQLTNAIHTMISQTRKYYEQYWQSKR